MAKGNGADLIQGKTEVKVENAWDSRSDVFFMELVLSNSKLLIFMKVERNPIFLVSKVLDVFEDLTIRKITLVLRTSAVV